MLLAQLKPKSLGSDINAPGMIACAAMYETIDVTEDKGPLEPMGSKPKFWFEHAEWGQCLFKASRPGSGEDWSEKLAERFAHHLNIPHARYELATYQGERGIVTPRITTEAERLVHGNELLIELLPEYQGERSYRTPLHTVQAVFEALSHNAAAPPRGVDLPPGIQSCADVLAGYLFLDALISNTDRHHENWAVIEKLDDTTGSPISLCPTFDHASSLGRNEPLAKMERRLATRDEGYTVEAYAAHAKSALYSAANPHEPVSPLDAYLLACEIAPDACRAWCDALASLDLKAIHGIVREVPSDRMPDPAKDFVVRMVWYNRSQLEELCQRR